jgi:GNAT superfamily N-acetyltransferase
MRWFMTADTAEFLSVTGEFLRAEAARNSVMLTVTADLTAGGPGADPAGMLFGWRRPAGGPLQAAFMHTPGYPIMLSAMSAAAAADLARELIAAGRQVSAVNAAQEAADAFTAAWRDRTGEAATVHRRMRLFRLGRLAPPVPAPDGRDRAAAGTDRDLLAQRWEAFALVAALTRAVGGMARIGPVYTPPALRGRGYAAAVTAAVSQAALDAGVRAVVLYTDLANPTSNALYERLGYRAVEDRVLLSFAPPVTLHP